MAIGTGQLRFIGDPTRLRELHIRRHVIACELQQGAAFFILDHQMVAYTLGLQGRQGLGDGNGLFARFSHDLNGQRVARWNLEFDRLPIDLNRGLIQYFLVHLTGCRCQCQDNFLHDLPFERGHIRCGLRGRDWFVPKTALGG